jgi:DNA-binding protein Fis
MEYSALILTDYQKDLLSVEAVYGVQREDHPLGCIRRPGVIGEILESCRPMVIQNLSQEPLYQEMIKGQKPSERIRTPLPCAPVFADGIPIGVLTTNSLYGPREDLVEDLQFLSILSMLLSPAIRKLQAGKVPALAKPDRPKLKFSAVEESLETKLTEVLDKLAPYTESKTHMRIFDDIIAVVERILIKSAMERVNHVQVAAAQLLGINRNTLRKKMKDLKIKSR